MSNRREGVGFSFLSPYSAFPSGQVGLGIISTVCTSALDWMATELT